MRNACVFAICGLAAFVAAIEFEQQLQLQAPQSYYYDGRSQPAEESTRTHHGSHKLKKMKKRLLLQCLLSLGQQRRRRRDTDAATGRFLIPFAVQNTNVNVGGGGGGGVGGYDDPQFGNYGGGGCMQMLNGHKPLLGQLGSPLGSLVSSVEESGPGNRNGQYTDWNRYARQFNRNFVRPLYRLF
ncbi:Hypothetical protein CINCED_3A007475 [Cinara cedri]|uniref:Uncharacterized protein n=1 Tax=Cinara cedri TaxID=506608 RepID=A0A5E4MYR6_9HEMI|nr:Hypothetical protein CINCED_3A007475 [Cinara cedri]